MKKYLLLISFSLLLLSCTEDVSKDINTDLTQEANQFFRFSEAFSESSYLGNISYSEFSILTSAELPGCPTIIKNPNDRIIELDYSSPSECEQGNPIPRTGKIILDFTLSNTITPTWSVTYENYFYNGINIEGTRQFERISLNENRESFENLSVKFEKDLNFEVNGILSYSTARLSFKPFALSARGTVEGRNPAGRDFSLTISEAKEQLFQCYREGWALPQSGKESWIVSRGGTKNLAYQVTFQNTEDCNPVVICTLPDGRTLQLNP